MKKQLFLSVLFVFLTAISVLAAESHILEFQITDGGSKLPSSTKRAMEYNAVRLLTMMSDAQTAGSKNLDFNGIAISEKAKSAIRQMWKYQPLRIWSDDGVPPLISENLLNLTTVKSYQVRNIPVRLFPVETPGKDKYSEVAINFSSNGSIEDFNITMPQTQYNKLLKDALTVQDYENRKMLAYWMDQLKMAYESKDVTYLNSLFDKDAMIITGVRTTQRTGVETKFRSNEKFDYFVKNREQYMAALKKIFSRSKEIRVNFRDQEYASNEVVTVTDRYGEEMPRYYMVWCTQDWWSGSGNITSYSDTGRLFVLWDFKNPERPTILVRAWTHPDDPKQFDIDDFILNE